MTSGQLVTVDAQGIDNFRAALLMMSRASGPRVRRALAEELKDVRDAMRANAAAGLNKVQRGDFKNSLKSFVFYRGISDIDLARVGGAVKAYGRFWIAHETGAVITRGADKWLLIPNPKYVQRYYGGKRRHKMPTGTYVAPIRGRRPNEMLGVFLALKTKRILLAVLKKSVTLRVRLALTEAGKHRGRNVAQNIVDQIVLGGR